MIENSNNPYLPWGITGKTRDKLLIDLKVARDKRATFCKRTRDKALLQSGIYNAIAIKDIEAIKAMIMEGVDLDKPNDYGKSPRAYARERGDKNVMGLLGC